MKLLNNMQDAEKLLGTKGMKEYKIASEVATHCMSKAIVDYFSLMEKADTPPSVVSAGLMGGSTRVLEAVMFLFVSIGGKDAVPIVREAYKTILDTMMNTIIEKGIATEAKMKEKFGG